MKHLRTHSFSAVLSALIAAVISVTAFAQVNIQGGGSSVKIDGSGVSITGGGAAVNLGAATGAAATTKNGKNATNSTGGKCVNGVLSMKNAGVGDRKFGMLACDLVVLENAGVGDMIVASITAKEVRVILSGVGNWSVGDGKAEKATYELTGTGDIKADKLSSKMSNVTISGVGNASVNAADTLNTVITGTGDVRYVGKPGVSSNGNGIGEVKPL